MTTNYKCSGCGANFSADPQLTNMVRCEGCTTILSLALPSASNYIDFQCPGCGMSHSADPQATPEMHCPSCLTQIKLGQGQPLIGQGIPGPKTQNTTVSDPSMAQTQVSNSSAAEPSIPQLGGAATPAAESPVPTPPAAEPSIPQLGGAATPAAESSAPTPPAAEPSIPQLGGASIGGMPQLGAAAKKSISNSDPAIQDEFPTPGTAAQNINPPAENPLPSVPLPETVPEDSENVETPSEQPGVGYEQSEEISSIEDQAEDKVRPAWQKFLLQPRVIIATLCIAPVMITVIVGAILVFIRCGTGIANGEGDMVTQGGQIVLGLIALWTMYIIGLTFYYADRDWVTDMGLFIVIIGAGWGMYAVITSFPSNFLAVVRHLFFGYVCLAAIGLAIWLLAPYKGIGSPR